MAIMEGQDISKIENCLMPFLTDSGAHSMLHVVCAGR